MDYRTLGQSDLVISSIGLGCVTFDREIDAASSYPIMDYAVERGITLFDTAEVYAEGKSEQVVGEWLRRSGKRDQIVLATKAIPPLGKRLVEAVEGSLRRLGTDVIDLYQLHQWDSVTPLDWTLETLDQLVQQGKIRYVGCSNFTAQQLKASLSLAQSNDWVRMQAIQPNYNVAIRDIEEELLPLCEKEQVGVITYSPLGGGFLTGKYDQVGVSPVGTRFDIKPAHWNVYQSDESMRRLQGLRDLADETDRSMVNLALSWVFGQPGLTSVLIGARKIDHIDQAFTAEEMQLTPELRQRINAL